MKSRFLCGVRTTADILPIFLVLCLIVIVSWYRYNCIHWHPWYHNWHHCVSSLESCDAKHQARNIFPGEVNSTFLLALDYCFDCYYDCHYDCYFWQVLEKLKLSPGVQRTLGHVQTGATGEHKLHGRYTADQVPYRISTVQQEQCPIRV